MDVAVYVTTKDSGVAGDLVYSAVGSPPEFAETYAAEGRNAFSDLQFHEAGSTVEVPDCSEPLERQPQLVVSFRTGSTGGGITGWQLAYAAGDREYLHKRVSFTMELCGGDTPPRPCKALADEG